MRRVRAGSIADLEPRDLDRVFERNVHQQIERNAARLVLEAAVSLAMPGAVRCARIPGRRNGRAPDFAGLLVLQIKRLARPVG